MFPIINLFGNEISTYALVAVIGILIAGFVFCQRIAKKGYDDNDAIMFLLVLAGGVLVGGHILFGITNIKYFHFLLKATTIKEFIITLATLFSGSVFYGGLIGGCIAGTIYLKIKKADISTYLDNCALIAPLFHGIARIGCFFGGCCYGIESSFGFCAYGNTISDIGEVRRFPVQLLESLMNFLIVLLIYVLLKKELFKGKLFFIYLSVYAVIRFFDEFLRGDAIRGFVLGLSTSQFISIIIEIVALSILFVVPLIKKHRLKKKSYQ